MNISPNSPVVRYLPGKSPLFWMAALVVANLLFAQSAIAHHPFGGQTPDTLIMGFLSGLGHPVVGLDHFVFVIATGLLATLSPQGLAIPIAFCLTAMLGTGLHVLNVDLPLVEVLISLSVILFGLLLILRSELHWGILATIGGLAGIIHGYAYGETVVGAEMSPLIAYLLGFTAIQMAIALSAWGLGKWIVQKVSLPKFTPLQLAGLAITAIGSIFLTTAI